MIQETCQKVLHIQALSFLQRVFPLSKSDRAIFKGVLAIFNDFVVILKGYDLSSIVGNFFMFYVMLERVDAVEEKLQTLLLASPTNFDAWTSFVAETEKKSRVRDWWEGEEAVVLETRTTERALVAIRDQFWGLVFTRYTKRRHRWSCYLRRDDIKKICLVYGSFLSEFPLCYGYWKKYANHKARLTSSDKVIEVYEQAIQSAPYCVDLWVDYCSFVMSLFEELSDVRRVFERGISYVGKDYRCHLLWDKYIEFEYSQKQWTCLAHIYIRTLEFPSRMLHRYFDSVKKLAVLLEEEIELHSSTTELQSDIVTNNDISVNLPCGDEEISMVIRDLLDTAIGSSRSKVLQRYLSTANRLYVKSCLIDARICDFENRIRRPYFHGKPLDNFQLENWHEYLDFIEIQENFDWIVKLYERCLIPCANYPEFWMRYVELMENMGGREIASFALDRATKVFLKFVTFIFDALSFELSQRVPEIHLFCARVKEKIGDALGAHAAFWLCDTDRDSEFIENVKREANMQNRMGNSEAALEIYEKAISKAKEKDKLENLATLYVEFSQFKHMITGSLDSARDVLHKGIEHLPHCKLLIEGYYPVQGHRKNSFPCNGPGDSVRKEQLNTWDKTANLHVVRLRVIRVDGNHCAVSCSMGNVYSISEWFKGLINFEMRHREAKNMKIIESIVARAMYPVKDVSEGMSNKDREDISSLYLKQFLDQFGTIHDIMKAWKLHRKLFPHLLRPSSSNFTTITQETLVALPHLATWGNESNGLVEASELDNTHQEPLEREPSQNEIVVLQHGLSVSFESPSEDILVMKEALETMKCPNVVENSEEDATEPSLETNSEVHMASNHCEATEFASDSEECQVEANKDHKMTHESTTNLRTHESTTNLRPPSLENLSLNSEDDVTQVINPVPATSQSFEGHLEVFPSNDVTQHHEASYGSNGTCMQLDSSLQSHDKSENCPSHMSGSSNSPQKLPHTESSTPAIIPCSSDGVSEGVWHRMNYVGQVTGGARSGFNGYLQTQPQQLLSSQSQDQSSPVSSQMHTSHGYPLQTQSLPPQQIQPGNQALNQYQGTATGVQQMSAHPWPVQNMQQQVSNPPSQPQIGLVPVTYPQGQVYPYPMQREAKPAYYYSALIPPSPPPSSMLFFVCCVWAGGAEKSAPVQQFGSSPYGQEYALGTQLYDAVEGEKQAKDSIGMPGFLNS
ncbi:hypothetical protein Sjap_000717 [Stephania japonica]|uniref:Pre-mRNA-processing factor 39 n=1 Tax=Stephania japonica TaxID=461633 RepID=A0AAP0KIN1_9MAGN